MFMFVFIERSQANKVDEVEETKRSLRTAAGLEPALAFAITM
jgi:hypothetical protein